MKKILLLTLLLLAACGGTKREETVETAVSTLTIMTHDSFAVSEETIAAFEAEHNIHIELLPSGDAGAALNQAILAKEDPFADVFFGVDNSFMSRALDADLFIPYNAPALSNVDSALQLDDSRRLIPIDYGDVCLNYDKAWQGTLPQTLTDLTDPAYKGLLVVENPATSSPGLAFLLATISEFGVDGEYDYLDFWAELRANEVLIANGWEEAYYGSFSVASEGDKPFVVSYASSPAAEFIYADPPVEEPPSGSITADWMCYRQVEFVGILQGTTQETAAQQFIDFMLSNSFQEDIPLNMFVFPALDGAVLPDAFVQWAEQPANVHTVPPPQIEENREQWIEEWTAVMLR